MLHNLIMSNANIARPAAPYHCHFCGAFNNANCLCGCAASREAAGERVIPKTLTVDDIALDIEEKAATLYF